MASAQLGKSGSQWRPYLQFRWLYPGQRKRTAHNVVFGEVTFITITTGSAAIAPGNFVIGRDQWYDGDVPGNEITESIVFQGGTFGYHCGT